MWGLGQVKPPSPHPPFLRLGYPIGLSSQRSPAKKQSDVTTYPPNRFKEAEIGLQSGSWCRRKEGDLAKCHS